MTSHTIHHLYTCHLLGADLRRNMSMKVAKSVLNLQMCDAPELFNVVFFINKGLLQMKDDEIVFYEVGKPDVVTVKREMEDSEGLIGAVRDEWRHEMGEVGSEMSTMNTTIVGLKGTMEVQNGHMAEAINVMMRMIASMEKRFPQAQQMIPPSPSSEPKQLGPGTFSIKKSTPTKKRKEVMTNPTTVSVKKNVPKQAVKETEEPAPSFPKKVKADHQKKVPQKSGSQRGQTQN